jgi:diguanylate cyclase (GGDEF)-like protein
MDETTQPTGSRRLTRQMKVTYWAALALIAAMATASYWLLDQKLAENRTDRDLLAIVGSQSTLSQRIVFQANQLRMPGAPAESQLIAALKTSIGDFEHNYDRLLTLSGAETTGAADSDRAIFQQILFQAPYHLDHFTSELAARARRFVAAKEQEAGMDVLASGYSSQFELAHLDAAVADTTLKAYAELRERLLSLNNNRLAHTLNVHRTLFVLTIALLAAVAMFIFRPMANAIGRKTSELVEARNSMAFLAAHDGLTGLHNRAFLIDHFETQISGAKRRGERIAVLQIDLDGFKQINDTIGHAAGDFVLATTARRLRETSRSSDMCVRLGGDEFVIVLNGAGASEDIGMVAKRVLDRLCEPMNFEGVTIQCAASGGIAVYPVDADTASDLLVHADLALYNAKKSAAGTFRFFSDELRRELEHRKMLERDIRAAIAERSFNVFFQPQVSLTNGSVAGIEALVRWNHPERGMISPAEFIPIAEKTGLMAGVGRIVMDKAIGAAAQWHREGIAFGRLAVNVSGTELREPDFARFLFATLEGHGLPPQKLSLEIVESVILDDEKTGIAGKLRQIRAAGVNLELDDFGTGYASLSHVNPNEIDRLKIDRRFVQKINTNDDNSAIVKAITELARGLGISIIAEGAETDEELSSLLKIGCEQVQGYSIAFPMPADQAHQWLAHRTPRKPILRLAKSDVA